MRPLCIMFTAGEARALLHRLETWDCIAQVFADTDGLEHLSDAAPERAEYMERELRNNGYLHVNPASELDREILREAVEGSTWVAIHDPHNDTDNTHQGASAAYHALRRASLKVAQAFGLPPGEIEAPNH